MNEPGASYEVGDILFYRGDDSPLAPADAYVWRDSSRVAVVRRLQGDRALVDNGMRLEMVSTGSKSVEVGNTVEVSESDLITGVLWPDPVKFHDFRESDTIDVTSFRADPGDLTLADFAGYSALKTRIVDLVDVSLLHPDKLQALGCRSATGILFAGPPGTGKTYLCKIIASLASATYYQINGPEIFTKWYGDSEKIIRELFSAARSSSPSLLVIDELDAIATQRSDTAHEASKRVVAQLLTEMDGLRTGPENRVTVIATTNRPNDIDLALRRPGRFDWEIDFKLPGRSDRLEILERAASRRQTDSSHALSQIADETEGWSAAELTAIWDEAGVFTVRDIRSQISLEDLLCGYELVQVRVAASRGERSI